MIWKVVSCRCNFAFSPISNSARLPNGSKQLLEIAKAVRTLTAPNRDDPLRQRRAEIAAIRQDLETLAREIPKAFKETSALVKAELRAALAKKI